MTSETTTPASIPGRRTVMAAAGVAGLAVALTACGSDDDSSTSVSSGAGAGGDANGDTGGDTTGGSTGGGDSAGGKAIAKTADIPEGGGKVFESEGVVITQPEAGTFKAFSSVCTHQGCAVKSVADGVINCPCHNSNFSIADGSVKSGPATKPLPAKEVTVSGDAITLA